MAQSEGSCRQTFFVSKAADAFYNSGKLYHIDGQHELAIQDYTEAIRLDPQYAIAYRGRGVVYSDLGQHKRSIQDYDEAIRLNPLFACQPRSPSCYQPRLNSRSPSLTPRLYCPQRHTNCSWLGYRGLA